jgi:hypothetical protein
MTLKSKPLAALVVVIFFGGIFVSTALGWWQTESTKEAAVFTSGDFAGQANPADIRGSYTFGDVEKNFGIPAVLLAEAFGVGGGDPAAFQVKSLEAMYADSPQEIGTASVRMFVAFYQALPFDLSADIYLPESAAALLRERPLGSEQAAYLTAHTVILQAAQPGADNQEADLASVQTSTPASTPAADTHAEPPDRLVRGKTTFAALLDWGVTKEAVESALGAPLPASLGMTVKDFCTQNGLSFETVKPALQLAVDQAK